MTSFGVTLALIVKIHVVLVVGQNSLTEERSLELIRANQRLYSNQLGTSLKLTRVQKKRNPYVSDTTIEGHVQLRLLERWEGFFRRRRGRTDTLQIALIPPLETGGHFYLAGYANGICSLNRFVGVAYATAEETNIYGQLRFKHSIIALAHEIGHLGGMTHDDTLTNDGKAGIMHSYALPFVDLQKKMRFSPKSRREWLDCVGSNTLSTGGR